MCHRPDILDDALLRPGRLDRLIYVSPPNLKARLEILQIHTRNMPICLQVSSTDFVDLEQIATRTDGFSGAEIAAICREAALAAMEEDPENACSVLARHFEVCSHQP